MIIKTVKMIENTLRGFLLFNSIKKGVDYGIACPTASMLGTKESFSLVGNFDINLKLKLLQKL